MHKTLHNYWGYFNKKEHIIEAIVIASQAVDN